jgi:hypothetical protein
VLENVPFSPNLPEEVRKYFELSKKLCIHGYFEYYFFDVAMLVAYIAAELALKFKLAQHLPSAGHMVKKKSETMIVSSKVSYIDRALRGGWRFRDEPKLTASLGSILLWARRKGYIAPRWQDRTESLRQLRNVMVHPYSHQFVGPVIAIESLHATFDFVNCLFDKEAWDNEPPAIRAMREQGEQVAKAFQEYKAEKDRERRSV